MLRLSELPGRIIVWSKRGHAPISRVGKVYVGVRVPWQRRGQNGRVVFVSHRAPSKALQAGLVLRPKDWNRVRSGGLHPRDLLG